MEVLANSLVISRTRVHTDTRVSINLPSFHYVTMYGICSTEIYRQIAYIVAANRATFLPFLVDCIMPEAVLWRWGGDKHESRLTRKSYLPRFNRDSDFFKSPACKNGNLRSPEPRGRVSRMGIETWNSRRPVFHFDMQIDVALRTRVHTQ